VTGVDITIPTHSLHQSQSFRAGRSYQTLRLTILNSLIGPDRPGLLVEYQRRSGMVPAIDGNSNQWTISVWIDHLSNWVESAAASASVHSGVSIEASVCGREEHVEPEYGASAVLSVEGCAALNLGVQALNRGAREKIAEP
jgi:hypothetical protein